MKRHWTKDIVEDNKRLRKEITDLKLQHLVEKFAVKLGNNILTILANTPWKDWPEIAKTCVEHEARRTPNIVEYYLNSLPKSTLGRDI